MPYYLYFVVYSLFWYSSLAVALATVEDTLAAVLAAAVAAVAVALSADSPFDRRKVRFLVRRDLHRLPSVGFLRWRR